MIVVPHCLYDAAKQWHVDSKALIRQYDDRQRTADSGTVKPIIALNTDKEDTAHARYVAYLRVAQAQYLSRQKVRALAVGKDDNGVGVMGIPRDWIPVLEKNGYSSHQLSTNVCANIDADALIMAVEAHEQSVRSVSHQKAAATSVLARPAPVCLRQSAQDYGVSYHFALSYYQHAQVKDDAMDGFYGPMHIPGSWLPLLRYAGFPEWRVQHSICWNIAAGVWILSAEHRFQGSVHTGWNARWISEGIPAIPANIVHYAAEASAKTGVPENLLMAVAWQESGFDPHAVSSAGAQGLMQFMPSTWIRFGQGSPFNPRAAMLAGAKYLRHLALKFHSWPLALAGYNAGGQAVERAGDSIPPYAQTQAYVPDVLGRYATLSEKAGK